MPDYRLSDGMDYELAGQVESNGCGTALTSAGTAVGSWTQLTAATTRNATGIFVYCSDLNFSVVTIGIGPPGSEVTLIPNLQVEWTLTYFFPIAIAAGTRISACRQAGSNGTSYVYVMLVEEGFASPAAFSRVTAYGVTPTNGRGVMVLGGSGYTKGAWTELTNSTTNKCEAIVASIGTVSGSPSMTDIGIGLAGLEQVIIGDIPVVANSNVSYIVGTSITLPCSIPAGTRIATRTLDSGGQYYYVAVYGIE
jgi:hypothetical protein